MEPQGNSFRTVEAQLQTRAKNPATTNETWSQEFPSSIESAPCRYVLEAVCACVGEAHCKQAPIVALRTHHEEKSKCSLVTERVVIGSFSAKQHSTAEYSIGRGGAALISRWQSVADVDALH